MVNELWNKLNKLSEKTKQRILNFRCYYEQDREACKRNISNAFEPIVLQK